MAAPSYVPTAVDEDVARQSRDDEALLRTARARFQLSEEAESELRAEFAIDQEFIAGKQWPDVIRQDRESYGQNRPILTINLFPGAMAQITNEQRNNPPTLRVFPAGGDSTDDVADIFDGLLRAIQRESRAEIAFATASLGAVGPGRGWMRFNTEYASPQTFEQKLTILSIPDILSVFPQPGLREPDYSDMQWCFIVQDMAHDEFLSEFPGIRPEEFEAWVSRGGDQWVGRETVRVAEYWYKEWKEVKLSLLSDGTVISRGGASRHQLAAAAGERGLTVLDERVSREPQVWCCKLSGMQVLSRTRWLGSWIPIIPVLGDVRYLDGRVMLSGVVRDGRDAARMINYWECARTEAIALAPRAPWIGMEGQFEGHEMEWETANTRANAYLEYRGYDQQGRPFPAPQRQVAEPAIQAINVACESAKNNFQATTRIYDASYGAPGNERSGRAIAQRDQNSDMSNSHYHGNLAWSLHHLGRQMLELLPKIYDEPGRVLRIVHKDGTEKQVIANMPHRDAKTGVEQFYDFTVGVYDVKVELGPSYERQRQDGIATMIEMAKADLKILQVADDLIVNEMPFPASKAIAARLKKTIDPKLLEDEGAAPDREAQLAQAQAQAAQLSHAAQALNAHAAQVEQAQQAAMQKITTLEAALAAAKNDDRVRVMEVHQRELEDRRQGLAEERRFELDRARLALESRKVEIESRRVSEVGTDEL